MIVQFGARLIPNIEIHVTKGIFETDLGVERYFHHDFSIQRAGMFVNTQIRIHLKYSKNTVKKHKKYTIFWGILNKENKKRSR